MKTKLNCVLILTGVGCVILPASCGPKSGEQLDEALTPAQKTHDYLKDMDRGTTKEEVAKALAPFGLSEDEAWDSYNRGRNNWAVWTAGNDTLWDEINNATFGGFDLVKTVSSHEAIKYCANKVPIYGYDDSGNPTYEPAGYGGGGATGPPIYPPGYYAYPHATEDSCNDEYKEWRLVSRENRWKYLGLVNEPCYAQADGPREDRFGLWLDKWVGGPGCPDKDPFEDTRKYPGVKVGARGREGFPTGSYYGYGTGVLGLRLFPNPDFDEEAQADWDAERFYNDPTYFNRRDLVRPYRVGMTCGFCHLGPSPINPPDDYENPKFANLTSNPGAQYLWMDRIFVWEPENRHKGFVYQLVGTFPPGTVDTSLVSSDNINNTRTMNAVYSIGARLEMAKRHPEKLADGSLNNTQFNHYKQTQLLSEYFEPPDTVRTAHVLKDGSDSVGILGALNRVYLNIGLFSEEWLTHFKPLLGGRISPIEIAVLEKNSTYWNANVDQTPDLALFFAASAKPDYLEKAPGGDAYLTKDAAKLTRGKIVFAENCARCHSGKQPPYYEGEGDPAGTLCELGDECLPGQILTNSASYFEWMRNEVVKPDFLENNFLSSEVRIPVTELGTNICSPLATNGLGGDIWDNFTSQTYKELPAVGKVTVHHPKTGEPWEYEMPGNGRGYTRPASLISLWSTAPFLLNNSVGHFYGAATVEARMASFNDAIQRMLWPEKRRRDDVLGDKVPGYIQRTTHTSYLIIPSEALPEPLSELVGMSEWLHKLAPWLVDGGEIRIGPIPKGTPVSLLASLNPVSESTDLGARAAHAKKLIRFLRKAIHDLKEIEDLEGLSEEETDNRAREVFADLIDPLVELSKCPDYVVNKGHYFGSNLSDDDKWALIEFLKTF